MKLKSNNKISTKSDSAIVRELCTNLKQMRLNRNISQTKLAELSGLDRGTISRMENGRAATLLTLVQVLRAMDNLSVLDTFKEEQEISPLQIMKQQESLRKKASPQKSISISKHKTK